MAGATLTVAAGAGGALAAGQHGRGPAGHPGPAAIASYLGLTPAQLREQLRAGKTLAQIAVAQGKSVAGLEDAIYKDVQTHLDQAVANGPADERAGAGDARRAEGAPRRHRQPQRPARGRTRRRPRPALRRRGRLVPRPHAGRAPHAAAEREVARADCDRAGQDGRRPEGGDPRRRPRHGSTRP